MGRWSIAYVLVVGQDVAEVFRLLELVTLLFLLQFQLGLRLVVQPRSLLLVVFMGVASARLPAVRVRHTSTRPDAESVVKIRRSYQ
jgi:hypothetical protein